jgi:hypothetical protein
MLMAGPAPSFTSPRVTYPAYGLRDEIKLDGNIRRKLARCSDCAQIKLFKHREQNMYRRLLLGLQQRARHFNDHGAGRPVINRGAGNSAIGKRKNLGLINNRRANIDASRKHRIRIRKSPIDKDFRVGQDFIFFFRCRGVVALVGDVPATSRPSPTHGL